MTELTIDEAMKAISKHAFEVLLPRFQTRYYTNPRDQWDDMEAFGQCGAELKKLADAWGIIVNTAPKVGKETK